ncbi:MAG: hypothetical protein ABRQ25_06480 [Clostridiaceae bacterium]
MSIEQKIIGSGIMFLLTIGAGFLLSNSGKPYNTAIFTIHKLIALGVVILTGILIFNLQENLKLETGTILLIILAIVSILALFVSGVLLSIGKVPYLTAKIIHIIAPITAVISIGLSIYLMLKKR